jgi:hypothetical protein
MRFTTFSIPLVLSLFVVSACGPYCEKTQTTVYSGGSLGMGSSDAVGVIAGGHTPTSSTVIESPGKWNPDGSCNGSLSFASGALPELLGTDEASWTKKHPDGKRSTQWNFSRFKNFATAMSKVLVLEAWASSSTSFSTSGDATEESLNFTQAELLSLSDNVSQPLARHVKSLKVVRGAGRSLFLVLITVSGRKIVATADSNLERACDLIDKSIPANQKLSFDTVNVQDGRTVAELHPFEGHACSKERIGAYNVFNFRKGTSIGDQSLPAITVIFEKNKAKPQSWVFFDRSEREDKKFFEELQREFSSALAESARIASGLESH